MTRSHDEKPNFHAFSRRQMLQGTAAVAGGIGVGALAVNNSTGTARAQSMPHPIVNVRSLGAKGDGKTNDTDAFAAAAYVINSSGGGTLLIPPGTYIVGKQTLTGSFGQGASWRASPIIRISGCTHPVLITGQGSGRRRAVLKAADGLRFGSFHPVTGAPFNPVLPFVDRDYQANAYFGMVELAGNASVAVANLELDGNIEGLVLGGFWGDVGRQCGASGILCIGNHTVSVEDVHTHHHGLDGVQVAYAYQAAATLHPHTLTNVRSEYNARQGLSWVGASGLTARNCQFSHTGRARFSSAPGAGVDVEPEDTQLSQGLFEDCEIVDNIGPAVVSDGTAGSNSVSNVTFRRCRILGTTTYSLLVRNPDFEFDACHITGTVATNPSKVLGPEKIRFIGCRIDNEGPKVFKPGLVIDSSGGESVLLRNCIVETVEQRMFHIAQARLVDCRFIARLQSEYATTTDWIAIVYACRVENCVFEDQIPNRNGPLLTINYSNDTTLIATTVNPPLGRLVLFNAS